MKLLPITFLMLFVAVSARDFKSGDNGLFRWDSGCFFYANSDEISRKQPLARPEECGGICIANPDCNHFNFNEFCFLIRSRHPISNGVYAVSFHRHSLHPSEFRFTLNVIFLNCYIHVQLAHKTNTFNLLSNQTTQHSFYYSGH